jgi:ATP/maltotriose-dependent transcriptional regulator MalT
VLLREVAYDDLLPGERASLHLAVARALERRLAEGKPEPALTAAIAHHYHAAGDQPEALRWAVLAARSARTVHARSNAAMLGERALELWDRVPDAEALAGYDHIELLRRTAAAHHGSDELRRLTLIGEALREVRATDPDDPRVPALLRDRSMAEWSLGRGEASRATLDLARRLLPDDASAADRVGLTTTRMKLATLQSRYGEVLDLVREAEAGLEEVDDAIGLRIDIDNNLGLAQIMTGDFERGCATMRRAIALGREHGHVHLLGISYTNFADGLQLRGRAEEAAQIVAEGLRQVEADQASDIWLRTLAAELAIDRGDLAAARDHLDRIGRTSGQTRVNVQLRLAELALWLDDLDGARDAIEEAELLLPDSLEPQFVAVSGVLRAELERRGGSLTVAREAIDSALERVEFCSDDAVRLGRLAVTGLAVEADAAQRARDLADAAQERDAIARAEIMLERARAAAAEDGPLELGLRATAEAHYLRATNAAAQDAWRAAGAAWDRLLRPPRVAAALWRGAESCLAHGDREGATAAAREALAVARRLGAAWLVAELEALAARGRLAVEGATEASGNGHAAPEGSAGADGDGDPFGLTPRERQVLGLVARGATNREIGAELFMAEKTASVHVSRILSKLDVRSRTEAAAVAHRLGLSEPAR